MDSIIASLPAERDDDLMLCTQHGIAYQIDRENLIAYDEVYYKRFSAHEQAMIASINAERIALVARHYAGWVLDVGIGSGEFIKRRERTCGFDVNPVAAEWLHRNDLWSDRVDDFGAVTFWDVLEHCADPGVYLRRVQLHAFVFASVPVFEDLTCIRASKHYRPGEHLQYWTKHGFVDWMYAHGFVLLEVNDAETRAGRDSILSFAFKRCRWPK